MSKRYIDADKLWNNRPQIPEGKSMDYGAGFSECMWGFSKEIKKQIDNPTADVVEVRHGHWISEEEAVQLDRYDLAYTCSVCGRCDWDCTESKNFNFCPNCGAKMDGGRVENGV